MATTKPIRQNILTLQFRQEKSDSDYGSCMWADYVFNLDTYDLYIASDCGNFGYGWVPTPNSESFIELMCRIGDYYLLGKISDRTVVDAKATYDNLIEFMKDLEVDSTDENTLYDLQEACRAGRENCVCLMLENVANERNWGDIPYFDSVCLYDCVETDYPAGAKKIAQVFKDHIQPTLKKLHAHGGEYA